MPTPRKRLVDAKSTPFYHCISRCVRRAYLCGKDKLTGKSYEHRRDWVVELLKRLTTIFAIDICSYAVMSNHYHVVLHLDIEKTKQWSAKEVIDRWHSLFKGNALIDKYISGEPLTESERLEAALFVEKWRGQLADISWFMRCMNESIARRANAEDECTGRFWEGRFKSQALLDVKGLICCMAYVDLNPIRAGESDSLEKSDFTSIQERLIAAGRAGKQSETDQPATLLPCLAKETSEITQKAIPMSLSCYIELVEATGKILRSDKSGYIPSPIQPTLHNLGIYPENFVTLVKEYGQFFKSAVGSSSELKKFNQHFGKCWSKGSKGSELFNVNVA